MSPGDEGVLVAAGARVERPVQVTSRMVAPTVRRNTAFDGNASRCTTVTAEMTNLNLEPSARTTRTSSPERTALRR
jgi:hypothetical protein